MYLDSCCTVHPFDDYPTHSQTHLFTYIQVLYATLSLYWFGYDRCHYYMTCSPTLTTNHSINIVVTNPNPLTPAPTHTVHLLSCVRPTVNKQPSNTSTFNHTNRHSHSQMYTHIHSKTLTHNLYYTILVVNDNNIRSISHKIS